MDNKEISTAVHAFFHDFAMDVVKREQVSPDNSRAMKMAMIEYYERIYPLFVKTEVFRSCWQGTMDYEVMVEEYKANFSLLLAGRMP